MDEKIKMATEKEIEELYRLLGIETEEKRQQYLSSIHAPSVEQVQIRVITTDSTQELNRGAATSGS